MKARDTDAIRSDAVNHLLPDKTSYMLFDPTCHISIHRLDLAFETPYLLTRDANIWS